MSIAFCKECDHIVEGDTHSGVEIVVNMREGTKTERRYECCNGCGAEVSGIACEPEENPNAEDR